MSDRRDKLSGRALKGWKTRRARQVTAKIWASATEIVKGESVEIFWSTTHADKNEIVILGMGEQYEHKAERKGSLTDQPEEATTYVIRAKGKWFKRGRKRFRKVTVRSVTVEVTEEEPEVITRKDYKPQRTSHDKREQHIEIVSRGRLKDDLSNVLRISITPQGARTRTYTRQQDFEALHYLIQAALE